MFLCLAKVLCLIEVSKEGLSEEELKAILHIDSGTWSPIFFAMASFILDRAGLYRYDVFVSSLFYSFFFLYLLFLPFVSLAYEDLSMAVNEYYLKEESDRLMFVRKLSNYFESKFQVTEVTY